MKRGMGVGMMGGGVYPSTAVLPFFQLSTSTEGCKTVTCGLVLSRAVVRQYRYRYIGAVSAVAFGALIERGFAAGFFVVLIEYHRHC